MISDQMGHKYSVLTLQTLALSPILLGDSCQDEGKQGTQLRTPLPLLQLHPQGRAPTLPVS